MMRKLLLQNQVLSFPVLYLGWAYLFWIPVLLSEGSVWRFPNLLWFLIGGASPLVAGLGLTALAGGRAGLRDIAHRLTDWRRIPFKWWFLILLFWLIFDVLMSATAMLLRITDSPIDANWQLFRSPGPLFFLLLLSFVFPAVEEVGLRGYYLDVLQQRYSLTTAAIINGMVWAAWHAPFVWFPGYYANTTFNPSLTWWLPMIVCHTLLISYVYNATGRSILAVLLFHGMMNFTGEWLRVSSDMYPFILSGNIALALLIVLVWKNEEKKTRLRGLHEL